VNEIDKGEYEKPLWAALLNAAGRVESRLEAELAGSGLSLAKLGILCQLVKAGEPLPLSRLAERLACVKSNVTQLIDRLENDGLVRRLQDPKDRRSTLASITREGRRLYDEGNRAVEQAERELFGHLDPAQRETLREICASFRCGG
jgi:DNA-binding MarR family transcriptional regulator